jgi:cytochrome c oxidase subunit 2
MTMLSTILAASDGGSFWMPSQASTVAGEVDSLFYLILYICYFFFFLIVALMVGFVWRYRFRKGQPEDVGAPAGHSTALEMLWTIPPTIIVLFIAWKGFRGYMDMAVPPPNAYEIQVTGQMWNWAFKYPNGHIDTTLHVPKDTPIRLVLDSVDVIHSLYIPHFRLKRDAVPGRFNRFWFTATMSQGERDSSGKWVNGFPVYCAEYCGTSHSEMVTEAIVHPNRQMFEDWLADASRWSDKMTYQERGAQIHQMFCVACHSVDGTAGTGPSWKNAFGATHPLADGSNVTVDEDYIRESIYYPQRKVVAGYPAGGMNSFLGQLSEEDVKAVIWYMKSISDNFDKSLLPSAPPEAAGSPAPGSAAPGTAAPAAPGS